MKIANTSHAEHAQKSTTQAKSAGSKLAPPSSGISFVDIRTTQLMAKETPKNIEIGKAKSSANDRHHLQYLLDEIDRKYTPEEEVAPAAAAAAAPAGVQRKFTVEEIQKFKKNALETLGGKQSGEKATLYVFSFNERYHISVELEDFSFHVTREIEGNPKVYWSKDGDYAGDDPEIIAAIVRGREIIERAKQIARQNSRNYLEQLQREKEQREASEKQARLQHNIEQLRLRLQLGKGVHQDLFRQAVENGWSEENIGLATEKVDKWQSKAEQVLQLKGNGNGNSGAVLTGAIQLKENNTGLPDQLKSGVESLSGIDMSDVKVHYNSSKPAQLNAHAYAQGNQIHIAPGQEKHLPHEAWHVVQQKQGRVRPTKQLKGKVSINDDRGLEKEADVMGGNSLQYVKSSFSDASRKFIKSPSLKRTHQLVTVSLHLGVVQRTKFRDQSLKDGTRAAPFQLAAVQFGGDYDIKQYASEITTYVKECTAAGTIPVIELRMYDAALDNSIIKIYLKGARAHLEDLLKTDSFDVTCSILRDETMKPAKLMDGDDEKVTVAMERFVIWAKSVKDLKLQHLQPTDRQYLPRQDRDLIDTPITQMLDGQMMIPLEEAFDFMTKSTAALQEIYSGSGAQRYSWHQRLLAKVIIENSSTAGSSSQQQQYPLAAAAAAAGSFSAIPKLAGSSESTVATTSAQPDLLDSSLAMALPKAPTPVAQPDLLESALTMSLPQGVASSSGAAASAYSGASMAPPPMIGRQLRRNSIIKPHTVTLTNLVTGNEDQTAQSTLAACQAAFYKGASQVLLIVEVNGYQRYPRAVWQKRLLEANGFEVKDLGPINGVAGVQQSGVKLPEPGDVPPRVKLMVMPIKQQQAGGVAAVGEDSIAHARVSIVGERRSGSVPSSGFPPFTYTEWYQKMVGANLDEAWEFENVYMPQYLDDLAASYPSRITEIHDIDPASFRKTYPHVQELYKNLMSKRK